MSFKDESLGFTNAKNVKRYHGKESEHFMSDKQKVAKKMTGNPHGVMEKNNKTMMDIDKHNRSWNGKKYTN